MPVRKAEAEEAAIGPGSLRKETVRETSTGVRSVWGSSCELLVALGMRGHLSVQQSLAPGTQGHLHALWALGSRVDLHLKQSTSYAFIPRPQRPPRNDRVCLRAPRQ